MDARGIAFHRSGEGRLARAHFMPLPETSSQPQTHSYEVTRMDLLRAYLEYARWNLLVLILLVPVLGATSFYFVSAKNPQFPVPVILAMAILHAFVWVVIILVIYVIMGVTSVRKRSRL